MIVRKVFIMEAAGDDAPYDPGKANIDKKDKIKKQIEKVNEASKDIDFHLERYQDISKRFKQKRETVMA